MMVPSDQVTTVSEFYFRRGKMLILCIGCFLFVALTPIAILLSTRSGIAGLVFHSFWVTANLLFFGTGFIWTLRALISPQRPGLIISDYGVTDHASAFSAGFIPWSAIHSITVGPVVTITLKDFKTSLRHLAPVKRWFQSTNVACFGGVMFSTTLLNATISELETAFADGYERWSAGSSGD
jgi:hypothetical protein